VATGIRRFNTLKNRNARQVGVSIGNTKVKKMGDLKMTDQGIPASSTDVSVEWLTDKLRQSGAIDSAAVTGIETKNIGEGIGIMGEVVRMMPTYDKPETGAPKSLVGKFPTQDPTNLAIAKSLYFYPREVAFYTQLAQYSPVRTAALYHADLDMTDHRFVLLLEDFAEAQLADQIAGTTPEQTETALQQIARLHGAWWGKVDGDEMAALFDFANPEYCAAVEAAFQGFLAPAFDNFPDCYSDYTRQVAEAIAPQAARVISELSKTARTFCHGDFRADNLMYGPSLGDDNFALLDWQISGRGGALYDVAYLICNSVPTAYRQEAERDLLRQYHQALMSHGVENYSFDECWEAYRAAVMCGLFVAVFTSGGMDLGNERGVELARGPVTT
jgi:hypothetical protein